MQPPIWRERSRRAVPSNWPSQLLRSSASARSWSAPVAWPHRTTGMKEVEEVEMREIRCLTSRAHTRAGSPDDLSVQQVTKIDMLIDKRQAFRTVADEGPYPAEGGGIGARRRLERQRDCRGAPTRAAISGCPTEVLQADGGPDVLRATKRR